MTNILLVGFGGFIGSILRYLASGYVQQASKSVGFPYGTLVVNVIGCFVIGFLAQLAETRGFLPPNRACSSLSASLVDSPHSLRSEMKRSTLRVIVK